MGGSGRDKSAGGDLILVDSGGILCIVRGTGKMIKEKLNTGQKALQINLDAKKYGTFAEIGAGQEVARWFFHVGRASGTVAKSISAYDMAISDELYRATGHYVSRERLESMLTREFEQLKRRHPAKPSEPKALFVFADTVATQWHTHAGQGW